MKKYEIMLPLFFPLFFGEDIYSQKKADEDIKWSGTISYKSIFKHVGSDSSGQIKTQWDHNSESVVTANFANNGGHAVKHEKTNNSLKTTFKVNPKNVQVEERTTQISCQCTDTSEVKVEIVDIKEKNIEAHKYWVSCYALPCSGTMTTIYSNSSLQLAGQPVQNETNKMESPETQITITDQPLGKDHTHLVGTTVERTKGNAGGEWVTTISWNLRKACPPWKNPLTEKNINTLDARVRGPATRFIKRVNDELCIKLKVVSSYRTKEEQDELYSQGRTKPGEIVTNAKGGQSNHNFRLAIDVYMVYPDGTIDLNGRVPPEVVEIAKQEGFEWGGEWKGFKDYPHFEMKF